MIQRLKTEGCSDGSISNKINELIDAVNDLRDEFDFYVENKVKK